MTVGIPIHIDDALSFVHAEPSNIPVPPRSSSPNTGKIDESSRLLTPQISYEAIDSTSETGSSTHAYPNKTDTNSQLRKRDEQGSLRSISSREMSSLDITENLQFDALKHANRSTSTSRLASSICSQDSLSSANISSLQANTKSLTRAFFLSINKSQIKISGMFLIPSLTYINSDHIHNLGSAKDILHRQTTMLLAATVMMGAYIGSLHSAKVGRYLNNFKDESRNSIIERDLPSHIALDEAAHDAVTRKIESHENLVATYGAIGISLLLFTNTINSKIDLLLTLGATLGILAYDSKNSSKAIDHIRKWSEDVEHCASDLDVKDNEALQAKVRDLSFDPVIFGLSGLVTAFPCLLGLVSLFDSSKSFNDRKSYMSADVLSGFRIFIGLWPNLTGLRQIALNNGVNQLNVENHLERLESSKYPK